MPNAEFHRPQPKEGNYALDVSSLLQEENTRRMDVLSGRVNPATKPAFKAVIYKQEIVANGQTYTILKRMDPSGNFESLVDNNTDWVERRGHDADYAINYLHEGVLTLEPGVAVEPDGRPLGIRVIDVAVIGMSDKSSSPESEERLTREYYTKLRMSYIPTQDGIAHVGSSEQSIKANGDNEIHRAEPEPMSKENWDAEFNRLVMEADLRERRIMEEHSEFSRSSEGDWVLGAPVFTEAIDSQAGSDRVEVPFEWPVLVAAAEVGEDKDTLESVKISSDIHASESNGNGSGKSNGNGKYPWETSSDGWVNVAPYLGHDFGGDLAPAGSPSEANGSARQEVPVAAPVAVSERNGSTEIGAESDPGLSVLEVDSSTGFAPDYLANFFSSPEAEGIDQLGQPEIDNPISDTSVSGLEIKNHTTAEQGHDSQESLVIEQAVHGEVMVPVGSKVLESTSPTVRESLGKNVRSLFDVQSIEGAKYRDRLRKAFGIKRKKPRLEAVMTSDQEVSFGEIALTQVEIEQVNGAENVLDETQEAVPTETLDSSVEAPLTESVSETIADDPEVQVEAPSVRSSGKRRITKEANEASETVASMSPWRTSIVTDRPMLSVPQALNRFLTSANKRKIFGNENLDSDARELAFRVIAEKKARKSGLFDDEELGKLLGEIKVSEPIAA